MKDLSLKVTGGFCILAVIFIPLGFIKAAELLAKLLGK